MAYCVIKHGPVSLLSLANNLKLSHTLVNSKGYPTSKVRDQFVGIFIFHRGEGKWLAKYLPQSKSSISIYETELKQVVEANKDYLHLLMKSIRLLFQLSTWLNLWKITGLVNKERLFFFPLGITSTSIPQPAAQRLSENSSPQNQLLRLNSF